LMLQEVCKMSSRELHWLVWEDPGLFWVQCLLKFPVWWPGNKNSPSVTHACRKRRLKWVAILPLGDINTEAWSARMEVGHGANNPTLKPPRNLVGFCGGGQCLSWAVEPRKEEEEEELVKIVRCSRFWNRTACIWLSPIQEPVVLRPMGQNRMSRICRTPNTRGCNQKYPDCVDDEINNNNNNNKQSLRSNTKGYDGRTH
jgi:hypothetical protein